MLWPLTARGSNLARLGRWYADRAIGGVVLTGPAGVGKTRLGEEARRAAGAPTARAVGHPATQSIPLGALAHLLPADLARDLDIGEDDRAGLFHRARARFAELAGDARLFLLVDDIDQLDDTSLALLLPLTIDRTIFPVVTMRAGRQLPAVIASLVKDDHLVLESLSTLTPDEVVTLLHRVLDGPIDGPSADRLAAVSAGNLQVLQEVVRRAQAEGTMRPERGEWRLSGLPTTGALDELVTSQVADLGAEAQRALDILAVAGTVGLSDLEALAEGTALEALEERGVIDVTVDGQRTRVALAHPMYGEVLRGRMTVLRERGLQRELADRVEALGCRRREDLTRLASWRLEAGGDVEASVLLRAGRLALIGRDAAQAERFAEAAASRGASHDAARIAIEAAMMRADPDAIERAVSTVWDDRSLPDGHRAHLTRRLASARFARGDLADALVAIDDAHARMSDTKAIDAMKAQRALLLANSGRPNDALDALVEISGDGGPRVRIEIASARSIACYSLGRFDEALDAAQRASRTQDELPTWLARRGMAAHLINEAHALAYAGRYRDARAVIEQALPAAQSAGAAAAEVWIRVVLGEIERDSGYGRAAIDQFDAAARLARDAGQQAALVWAWVGVAQGHLLLGEGDAAAAALARADDAGESPVANSWSTRERTRAWLSACRGDLVGARELLTNVAEAVEADGILVFEAALRHDLVRFGDPEGAVDRLDSLSRSVEGPLIQAMAVHARAACAADITGYVGLIDALEAMDCIVLAAEAAMECADLRRRQGDPRAAAADARRAVRLIERAGGARTPALVRGSGIVPLTRREREVAMLAAAGASSKAIASRLGVSNRTVDTHLDRAYRKLGVTSRDQLGAALDLPVGSRGLGPT